MAKSDLFHNSKSSIPKKDERVVRVALDHNEVGARKGHISGALPKNQNTIRHV